MKKVSPKVSEAARLLSSLGAHLGGQERARKLSKARKREIGAMGAEARWRDKRKKPN